MLDSLKKIFLSRMFRLVFSVVLVYVAFSKINIQELISGLLAVPWWFVLVMTGYSSFAIVVGSVRWAFLLLDKPKIKDFAVFVKMSYMGGFYSLFLSSSVGGDLLKWLPLIKRYPHLTKARIASSVLIDRMVGLSAFIVLAFVSMIIGKITGFVFPDLLFWLFVTLFFVMSVVFAFVYKVDFDKLFFKFSFLKRLSQVVELLKKENKRRLALAFFVSLLGQPLWIGNIWLISRGLMAGISLISTFIFIPAINLILALPISVGGFGVRENMFVYFFSQTGVSAEKILLVSTYSGIIGIVNAIIGGLIVLFSSLKSEEK